MKKYKWYWSLLTLSLVVLIGSTAGCITITPSEGPAPSALLTYTDETNGFSISYPGNWERAPEELLGGAIVGFSAPREEHGGKPNFTVFRRELPSEMSVDSFFETSKSGLQAVEGYTFVSKQDIVIDGMPAIKYVYTVSRGGTTIKGMQVLLVQGKSGWIITHTCAPESFGSLEPTFDAIAAGFCLLEAAAPTAARPVINSFTASPETISSGQSVTLSWNVSGATTVTIQPMVGSVSASGAEQVSPTTTTTYTLTATHEGWSSKKSITVTVTSAVTGKPDLIITDIWLTGTMVYYKIKNQGDASAKPSRSYLYINGPKVASDYVEPLASGQERTQSFGQYNYARPAADIVTVKLCADVDNAVDEGDEGNNCGVVNWGLLFSYDFVKKAHLASWRSGAGELEWPMVAGDKKGAAFVRGNAVVTCPEQVSYGWIQGRFADFYTDEFRQPRSRLIEIPEKAKFSAKVGFQRGASPTAEGRIALGFVDATGSVVLFPKMDVYNDGELHVYEIDLSDMAGEKTEFILWVEAKDPWEQGCLRWVEPKIIQEP